MQEVVRYIILKQIHIIYFFGLCKNLFRDWYRMRFVTTIIACRKNYFQICLGTISCFFPDLIKRKLRTIFMILFRSAARKKILYFISQKLILAFLFFQKNVHTDYIYNKAVLTYTILNYRLTYLQFTEPVAANICYLLTTCKVYG